MPAAAVIPAPIAYIKVAAVKKLVVGFQSNLWGPLIKGFVCTVLVCIHSSHGAVLHRVHLQHSWWLLL